MLRKSRVLAQHFYGAPSSRYFSVYVWGNGDSGQLGLGPIKSTEKLGNPITGYYNELEPVRLDTVPLDDGEHVVEFAGGSDHSLAVTSLGKVFAWGQSKHGKLGLGGKSKEMVLTPKRVGGELEGVHVVSVACGDSHSCAVDSNGKVYTWGWGGDWFHGGGLLGHGDNEHHVFPKRVQGLEEYEVDVAMATAGELHSALLTTAGQVFTCGAGEFGRLGLGGTSDVHEFSLLEWIEDEKVVSLVSGHAFSMALTDEGKLWVWGRNDQGQLGQGGTMSLDVYSMQSDPVLIDDFEDNRDTIRIAKIAAGHSHAVMCTADGDLYMWGSKTYLSPKKFDVVASDGSLERVVDVCGGLNFTFALTASGRVYSFGSGNSACLGHGDKKNSPQPALVSKLSEVEGSVVKLRAGHRHAFALVE